MATRRPCRFISFSHFEADESGALNEWLAMAPRAEAACSQVGALVSVNDFALRPARGLGQDEVIDTGRHRLRFARRRRYRSTSTGSAAVSTRWRSESAP